ncbi:MAG: class II glutamine amidotransferase [Nitrospira sp.]|nr:class II glutamine amidotransferase [Nitrospira sp.]
MFKIPPLTSDILAASFDAPSSPAIHVKISPHSESPHSLGWGFGWYPGNERSAMVVKDPAARDVEIFTSAIADWSNFRSNLFFCKVRGASDGYTQAETQPFSRSFSGRDWLFMHNGDLDKGALATLLGQPTQHLEPLAGTDSEMAFCHLLFLIQESGARQILDVDPMTLRKWFQIFDGLGSADMFLSDGQSIACFQGAQSPKQLSFARHMPPNRPESLVCDAAEILFSDPRDMFRTSLMISSSPFEGEAWSGMRPGDLLIANHGAIVWTNTRTRGAAVAVASPVLPSVQETALPMPSVQAVQAQSKSEDSGTAHVVITSPRAVTQLPNGRPLSYRMFDLVHITRYEYTTPVEHSTHVFRLQPLDDRVQEVVRSSLVLSPKADEIQYEDVFGNQALHCTINKAYTELSVTSNSRVKIYATPPDDHSYSHRQTSIPLVWMPWQRQMMMPYLLPPELPETQLRELTQYAMGFVERSGFHLLKTIKDINLSIYQDYKYVSGSTSLSTTPFDVYTTRQGVCQDFANLFICLTRLLNIPARYRMGYIHTGSSYENKIQSDASHAWAEVYLPYVGWRGFDPTNGCMVSQDHIRVACGRTYLDATPTSGTIYKGGGTETMTVEVKMTEVNE